MKFDEAIIQALEEIPQKEFDHPETALRMLAAHIGGLRHDLDELRREMRQARWDQPDSPARRRKRAEKRRADAYKAYLAKAKDRGAYAYRHVTDEGSAMYGGKPIQGATIRTEKEKR